MKRIIAIFASVCLIASGIAVKADNAEIHYFCGDVSTLSDGAVPSEAEVMAVAQVKESCATNVYEAIRKGFIAQESAIDISMYEIDKADIDAIIQFMFDSFPELFFLGKKYRYSYVEGNYVYELYPTYIITGDEYVAAMEFYANEILKIVNSIPQDASRLEKVLLVHDYIADKYRYDEDLYSDSSAAVYDAYNMLLKGRGVCQAYTLLFTAIMNELDIECTYVSSQKANHIWNAVKMEDGYFYHLDVTWDDPYMSAIVSHNNFLISTEKVIKASPNKSDWVSPDSNFGSDKYESGYCWNDCNYPFRYLNGKIYGAKFDESNYSMEVLQYGADLKSEGTVIAKTKADTWHAAANSYYIGYYSGFSLIGDTFVYNTTDALWYLRFINGEWQSGKLPYEQETESCCYGSFYDGNGHIVLLSGETPNKIDPSKEINVDLLSLIKEKIPTPMPSFRQEKS